MIRIGSRLVWNTKRQLELEMSLQEIQKKTQTVELHILAVTEPYLNVTG
jgi:hypothetical protein